MLATVMMRLLVLVRFIVHNQNHSRFEIVRVSLLAGESSNDVVSDDDEPS